MTFTKNNVLILLLAAGLVFGCKSFSRVFARSGSEFVVQVETNEPNKDEVFRQAAGKLKSEINALGLSGEVSEIPDKLYFLDVKIYEPKDIERAKEVLFTNYQLELRKVVSPPSPNPLRQFPTEEAAGREATESQEILPYKDKNSDLQTFVIVDKEPVVTGRSVRSAKSSSVSAAANDYSIQFSLNPEGAQKFGAWTITNINNYLAIVLNKKIVSVAYIKSQIMDNGQIDGGFSKGEAENIAFSLNSGHLPATFKVLSETAFGK